MESMQELIGRLQATRNEQVNATNRIDKAIELLKHDGATNGVRPKSKASETTSTNLARKTMSPEARRRISIAMKKRHAAARNAKPLQTGARKKPHWTQTPAGRKKFAAIRAKSHQKAA
jgi:hypothetical protein